MWSLTHSGFSGERCTYHIFVNLKNGDSVMIIIEHPEDHTKHDCMLNMIQIGRTLLNYALHTYLNSVKSQMMNLSHEINMLYDFDNDGKTRDTDTLLEEEKIILAQYMNHGMIVQL